jgi:hypothetical protein
MSDDKPKPTEQANQPDPPDGRGPRPADPNELARWIVEQTAGDDQGSETDDES